jgi:SWI/SNF-related matrix-associated actin-dependent regulator of chromatin subfamily A-like protein 1
LILDESHRIKTPGAKTTKAILELRQHASRRYILSGTPVANKPDDLWTQILFLDDGDRLGTSFEQFKQRYHADGGYRDLSDLRGRIASLSLRRTKAGSLDLPGKTYTRIEVDLAPIQQSMYESMRTQLELYVRSMDGDEVVRSGEAILARLVHLAQIASNPALLDSGYGETPAKVTELDRLLEARLTRRDEQKVIVWSSFVGNLETLSRRYSKWAPVTIHGDVSSEQRDAAVKAFKTDPHTRLLLANPAAAREGLTLTESNLAIYMDRTFNLTDYLQSQDRIHRISQTRNCEIVLLIGRQTVDEFIDYTLDQKHRLARYTQNDTDDLKTEDVRLERPEFLRALIGPA